MEEYSKENGVPIYKIEKLYDDLREDRPSIPYKPSSYGSNPYSGYGNGNYGETQRRRGRPRKHESVSHNDLLRKITQGGYLVDQILQIHD